MKESNYLQSFNPEKKNSSLNLYVDRCYSAFVPTICYSTFAFILNFSFQLSICLVTSMFVEIEKMLRVCIQI